MSVYRSVAGPFASESFAQATLGPFVVGYLCQLLFFGAVTSQLFCYTSTSHYNIDSFRIKGLVFTAVGLAFIQCSLTMETLYHLATWQQRDAQSIMKQSMVECLMGIVGGAEGLIVQTLLAQQAAQLFKTQRTRMIYVLACAVGIFSGAAGAVLYSSFSFVSRSQDYTSLNLTSTSGVWQFGSALAGTLIAVPIVVISLRKLGEYNANAKTASKSLIILYMSSVSWLAISSVIGAALCYAFGVDSQYTNASAVLWQPITALQVLSLLTFLTSRPSATHPTFPKVGTGFGGRNHGGVSVNISFVQTSEAPEREGTSSSMYGAPARKYNSKPQVAFEQDGRVEKGERLGVNYE